MTDPLVPAGPVPLPPRSRLGTLSVRLWGAALFLFIVGLIAYFAAVFRYQEAVAATGFVQEFWVFAHSATGRVPLGPFPGGQLHPAFYAVNMPVLALLLWPLVLVTPSDAPPADVVLWARLIPIAVGFAGGIPMFLTAVIRGMRPWIAFALTALFLLHPAMHRIIDMHPIGWTLAPAALAILFHALGMWRSLAVSLLAFCASHPSASLTAVTFVLLFMGREGTEGLWRRRILWVCGIYLASLVAANLVLYASGVIDWELWMHSRNSQVFADALAGRSFAPLLSYWRLVLYQAVILLAAVAFVPLLAGRGALVLAPVLLYSLGRDSGLIRGDTPALVGVMFFLALLAFERHATRPGAPPWRAPALLLAIATATAASNVLVEDFGLGSQGTLVMRHGVPFVTHPSNAVLDAVRREVRGSARYRRVLAEIDLAPLFMDARHEVGVFGVDQTERGWDAIVLRAGDRPHLAMSAQRFDRRLRCPSRALSAEAQCLSIPADYEGELGRLRASGLYEQVVERNGISLWLPRGSPPPAEPALAAFAVRPDRDAGPR